MFWPKPTTTVCWHEKEILLVIVLRFLIGFILARTIIEVLPGTTVFWMHIFDRLILMGLVFFMVWRAHGQVRQPLGLRVKPIWGNLLLGILAGVILQLIGYGSERFLTNLTLFEAQPHPLVQMAVQAKSARAFLVPLFLGTGLAPLAEEIFYRGFAYPVFKNRFGLLIGVLLSGIFFALMHGSGFWFIEIMLVGLGLTLVYEFTGSLLPGMIAHGLLNAIHLVAVYLS